MTQMKRIKSSWNGFQRDVIPKGASSVQRDEMEKSFYAGAVTVVSVMIRLSSKKIPMDEAAEVFKDLITECKAFLNDIRPRKTDA